MLLPDSVLAALIAGTATLSASFVQLRSALLRQAAGGGPASRRRNRLQLIIFCASVGAAALAGFALSQWLTNGERTTQVLMQRELQARVAEITRTANQLELTRGSERAEIESGVLRRQGADGVIVMATVAACAPATATPPAAAAAVPTAASSIASANPCTEAEATPVTLCATIPANASVTEVALYSRAADSTAAWSASRQLPGQESGQARFAAEYSESASDPGARQVCQAFTHWSDHARVVRIVVRYSLGV